MKIKTQSLFMLLFSLIVTAAVGLLILRESMKTEELNTVIQAKEEGLTLLNEFQVSSMAQVLYGIDVVRTGDISGDRITTYRMAETQFNREIENLQILRELCSQLDPEILELSETSKNLSQICREELLDPLYAQQNLDEGIIERLIYKELTGLKTQINLIRNKLNQQIREDRIIQKQQQKSFFKMWLPAGAAALLILTLINFFIIQLILSNINKTRDLLDLLAEGQSRLDVSLPIKGNNEISLLRNNFNRFMENLNQRYKALLEIADSQLKSGEQLNDITLEHSSAVKQIRESLNTINDSTHIIENQIQSSVGEVSSIAGTLDSLKHMTDNQEKKVRAMASRGNEVSSSLASQKNAVEEQVILTQQVKKESLENRRIMELLKQQIMEILTQSSQISEAIHSIQDLADQTDVLAINASIEAAHAGIYGKGFAVVAGEMRKLSNQVRENSDQVTALLSELDKKIFTISEEEQQSQEIIVRLIRQNDKAETAVQALKHSNNMIQEMTEAFFETLKLVLSGSSQIHSLSEDLRGSSRQITLYMEGMRDKQNELVLESEEMTQGITQLAKGTDILGDLSRGNKLMAVELNEEIHKLGS